MSELRHLEDIAQGEEFVSAGRTITEADIVSFAGLSGDYNPLHVDAEFAAKAPFGQRIAHGMLVASISTGLRSALDDWAMLAFLSTTRNFTAPVFIGDTIRIRYRVIDVQPSRSRAPRGVVRLDVQIVNQDGDVTQAGEDTILVATRSKEKT